MDFESAAEILSGIPYMDPHHGRVIYDHVRETRPRETLEIGTANGVSAGYMAAALQENGGGRITTLDSTRAGYQPGPVNVLDELGLREYVELVRRPDTSYTWYLKSGLLRSRTPPGIAFRSMTSCSLMERTTRPSTGLRSTWPRSC